MSDTPQQLTPEQSRRAMFYAIVAQCFGVLSKIVFQNNLLFLYLRALGMSPSRILSIFSLHPLAMFAGLLPLARLADRYGKSRLGVIGTLVSALAFGLLLLAPFLGGDARFWLVAGGIVLFGLGYAGFSSGWFALLSPVVPVHQRGRFFGALRFAWQGCGALFTFVMALVITKDSPVALYAGLIGFVTLGLVMRIPFYLKIPELEKAKPAATAFWPLIGRILKIDGFASFLAYSFLIFLCVGCCPVIFSLVQKEVHQFSDRLVALNGNLAMVGMILGFLLGGMAVDRLGSRPIFIVCHFGYGTVLLFIVLRMFLPLPVVWTISSGVFFFSFVSAASSVAFSTELMALLPSEGKSVAASIQSMMMAGGGALSSLFSAQIIEFHVLAEKWTLWGREMSQYDTILMGCGLMIVLLVVTLGLVPSVLKHKAEWIPPGF